MDTSRGNPRLTLLGLLCVGFGLFGLLGALVDPVASSWVHLGSWGRLDPTVGDGGQFFLALIGGIMAGWGAMMISLAGAWTPTTAPALRRAVLVGTGVWYVLDSGGSVLTGAWPNVFMNSAFLLTAIWASRR